MKNQFLAKLQAYKSQLTQAWNRLTNRSKVTAPTRGPKITRQRKHAPPIPNT